MKYTYVPSLTGAGSGNVAWSTLTVSSIAATVIPIAAVSTKVRQALILNTSDATINFGPDTTTSLSVGPGDTYLIPETSGSTFDLNTWYFVEAATGAAGKIIKVTYSA